MRAAESSMRMECAFWQHVSELNGKWMKTEIKMKLVDIEAKCIAKWICIIDSVEQTINANKYFSRFSAFNSTLLYFVHWQLTFAAVEKALKLNRRNEETSWERHISLLLGSSRTLSRHWHCQDMGRFIPVIFQSRFAFYSEKFNDLLSLDFS